MKLDNAPNRRVCDQRLRPVRAWLLAVLALVIVAPRAALAQPEPNPFQNIKWGVGPTTANLGSTATIKVPAGYKITDPVNAKLFMEACGNPPSGRELGILSPAVASEANWFVIFSFEDSGYVKDDDKADLGPETSAKILQSIRDGTAEANKTRAARGWPTMNVDGWEQTPFYDNDTHLLTWAIRGSSKAETNVNYQSRVLGRRGVMHVTMVLSPTEVATTIPKFKALIAGMDFKPDERYDQYRSGDKIAQYGLVSLITGGAAVAIAKSSKFLIKIGVFIVAALVGLAAKVKSFFTRRSS